jgi:MarR-like DNA-binding transcriptional regulator SgrR of sgrS sRNA
MSKLLVIEIYVPNIWEAKAILAVDANMLNRKYLKWLTINLIGIFSGYAAYGIFHPTTPDELRVATTTIQAALRYDPADILFSYENIFLENIYSTLVEFDNSGVLVPGLAESYSWQGDDLVLKMREAQTENGTPITAEDAAFSLKRLILLAGNTQGNFKNLVCGGAVLKTIDSPCSGISVRGDSLILNAGSKKSFLLTMLTATEFSIVPRVAVNKNLKIKDMRQTSGPYYVDKDAGMGNVKLRLNKNHFHASIRTPQTIQLVPIDFKNNETPMHAFKTGKVDHLMTVNGSKPNELLEFVRDNPEYEAHLSHRLSKYVLTFTKKGLKRFTAEQRRWFSRRFKASALAASRGWLGSSPANQFFLATGDGGLTQAELNRLPALSESPIKVMDIRVGFLQPRILESWSPALRDRFPGIDLYIEKDVPDQHHYSSPNEEPDAYVCNSDGGSTEDVNLLSTSFIAGHLGLSKTERAAWLADYMATTDSRERLGKLRAIHYNALASASVTPIIEYPFVAIIKKPWTMKLSALVANNPLWKIYSE